MIAKEKVIRGFTLLEVIIAISILAFIATFTARMIQQGVQSKSKIQGEIDRKAALIAALNLIRQDIQSAFHYRDINVELHNAAQELRKKNAQNQNQNQNQGQQGQTGQTGQQGQTGQNQNQNANAAADEEKYKLKEVKTISRFLGEKDSLNFTSLNFFRSQKNIQVSDQAEIGYYLENCSSRLKKDSSSECLWRRVSPYIDDDIKEGGEASVLLENVKSLTFRYITTGPDEEWRETWRSENGEEIMKNKFPFAVEITLAINDTRFDPPKEVVMTVVAPLKFPNNKPEEKSNVVN